MYVHMHHLASNAKRERDVRQYVVSMTMGDAHQISAAAAVCATVLLCSQLSAASHVTRVCGANAWYYRYKGIYDCLAQNTIGYIFLSSLLISLCTILSSPSPNDWE